MKLHQLFAHIVAETDLVPFGKPEKSKLAKTIRQTKTFLIPIATKICFGQKLTDMYHFL